jgi:hypothetical protein
MNDKTEINLEEAQGSLESVNNTKQKALALFRPPFWLNILFSLLSGFAAMATILSSHNSEWSFLSLVSAIGLVLAFILWGVYLRVSGCRSKNLLIHSRNRFLNIGLAILIAFTILGFKELYNKGFTFAPYVTALIIAVIFSYVLHKLPNGEWINKG